MEVSNEALNLDMIPAHAQDKVSRFAHTFNGYEYAETMEQCGEIMRRVEKAMSDQQTDELTLSDIRATLFYYYRALRHGGQEQEDARVEQFLALIRDRVEKGLIE